MNFNQLKGTIRQLLNDIAPEYNVSITEDEYGIQARFSEKIPNLGEMDYGFRFEIYGSAHAEPGDRDYGLFDAMLTPLGTNGYFGLEHEGFSAKRAKHHATHLIQAFTSRREIEVRYIWPQIKEVEVRFPDSSASWFTLLKTFSNLPGIFEFVHSILLLFFRGHSSIIYRPPFCTRTAPTQQPDDMPEHQ